MNREQRGFTLIEVLIAMAITAVIALLAYTSLNTVIAGVESVRREADYTYQLNRAFQLLSRDLRQVVERPIRDELDGTESALEGGPLARQTLALTRAGWHNTVGLPRSTPAARGLLSGRSAAYSCQLGGARSGRSGRAQ